MSSEMWFKYEQEGDDVLISTERMLDGEHLIPALEEMIETADKFLLKAREDESLRDLALQQVDRYFEINVLAVGDKIYLETYYEEGDLIEDGAEVGDLAEDEDLLGARCSLLLSVLEQEEVK